LDRHPLGVPTFQGRFGGRKDPAHGSTGASMGRTFLDKEVLS
jgi:hypothetical protein